MTCEPWTPVPKKPPSFAAGHCQFLGFNKTYWKTMWQKRHKKTPCLVSCETTSLLAIVDSPGFVALGVWPATSCAKQPWIFRMRWWWRCKLWPQTGRSSLQEDSWRGAFLGVRPLCNVRNSPFSHFDAPQIFRAACNTRVLITDPNELGTEHQQCRQHFKLKNVCRFAPKSQHVQIHTLEILSDTHAPARTYTYHTDI